MTNTTLKKWLIAVALLLPCAAGAAGMGRLTVLSALGQPFNAEIELVSVQKEDLASLSVRLASPEAYQQANLQYSSALIGLRIAVELRPDGQPFVRVTSSQGVNDPFLDLLVELNWASGRLVREFTALLDPPGLAPSPPAVATAPLSAPEAQPTTRRPVAEAGQPRAVAPAGSYGPVERGETLSKIAGSLKPEGVTLEQMLVGLYRSNPDAFIRKNMNLVRTGRILRVPEKDEIATISQGEAIKEYRAQVADWKSYRAQLAEAPAPAREGSPAASGRITTRIDEKAPTEPKDVVRLSKGEAPGLGGMGAGTKGSTADRIRALEEEVTAREKALKEANERVAQLEKTIKDMQRLAEIKSQGLATAQQQAQAKAGATPEAPKPDAAKPEAKGPPTPEPAAPKPEPDKAAEKPAPKPAVDKPKPKPVVKAQSAPPAPEPSLLDTLPDPVYLGGGAILLLGGLGYWLMRRRRGQHAEMGPTTKAAPTLAALDATQTTAQAAAPAAVAAAAELDPLDEANAYISLGRDAQAEATLTEAIAKDPGREELQVKLLEIYAQRKDKVAFAKHAAEFHKRTAGVGDNWLKVAAMGFGLDPGNPLFGSGKVAPDAAASVPEADLDFNLDEPAAGAASAASAQAPTKTDFEIEIPPEAPEAAPAAPASTGTMNFEIEVPKLEVPPVTPPTAASAAPAPDAGAPLDFKLDLGALDLSLDDKKPAAAVGGGHDPHWHDVQAKFDLAKAYQEMGDRAGASEILKEVMREGDAEQQGQARKFLDSLG